MEAKTPAEAFPSIGTVQNPALFSDEDDLLLSYEIAPVAGGGIAILRFSSVIHFEQNPTNSKGLADAKYPTRPWEFSEISGADRTEKWESLQPRFWTVSFNDVTVEVVFEKVEYLDRQPDGTCPSVALVDFLSRNAPSAHAR